MPKVTMAKARLDGEHLGSTSKRVTQVCPAHLVSYMSRKAWGKSLTQSLNTERIVFGTHVMDVEPLFVNINIVAGNDAQVMDKMKGNLSAHGIALKVKKA